MTTRRRLVCGIVAGPLFLAVSYGQAFTRPGFDLTRNAFSYLSLGDLGWIQTINFVLCGLLFVVAATGMRHVMHSRPGGTWGPLLIAVMGMSMIAGGVFVLDPSFGYPPGAPDGQPDSMTWHGALHAVAFGAAIMSWIAACVVFARRFAAAGQHRWAIYSSAIGLILLAPLATIAAPPGALLIYIAATFGWTWTSAISLHLLRETFVTSTRTRPAVPIY